MVDYRKILRLSEFYSQRQIAESVFSSGGYLVILRLKNKLHNFSKTS